MCDSYNKLKQINFAKKCVIIIYWIMSDVLNKPLCVWLKFKIPTQLNFHQNLSKQVSFDYFPYQLKFINNLMSRDLDVYPVINLRKSCWELDLWRDCGKNFFYNFFKKNQTNWMFDMTKSWSSKSFDIFFILTLHFLKGEIHTTRFHRLNWKTGEHAQYLSIR